MKILSATMGAADLICTVAILWAYGLNIFTGILSIVMIYKGVFSFL